MYFLLILPLLTLALASDQRNLSNRSLPSRFKDGDTSKQTDVLLVKFREAKKSAEVFEQQLNECLKREGENQFQINALQIEVKHLKLQVTGQAAKDSKPLQPLQIIDFYVDLFPGKEVDSFINEQDNTKNISTIVERMIQFHSKVKKEIGEYKKNFEQLKAELMAKDEKIKELEARLAKDEWSVVPQAKS